MGESSLDFDFNKFKYLTIGGGNFSHREDGWLNLDFPFDAMAKKRDFTCIDICHNLMVPKPIPIPDNSLEVVYTEHAMEHLPENTARFVFTEAFRMLKPNGVFRVSVPNAKQCWNAYVDEAFTLEEYPSCWRPKGATNSKEMCFLDAVCTPLRRIITKEEFKEIVGDSRFYNAMNRLYARLNRDGEIDIERQERKPGDHLSWWDNVTLMSAISFAGFSNIRESLLCRNSIHPALRADYIDCTQHKWSVRMEGIKSERFSC